MCVCDHKLIKLDEGATEAIFIGYTSGSHGYKLRDAQKMKVIVSRDVRFYESNSSQQRSEL